VTPRPLLCYFAAVQRFSGAPRTVLNFVRMVDGARFRPVLVTQVESPVSERVRAEGIETVILPFPPLLRAPRPDVLRRGLAQQLRTAGAAVAYSREVQALARRLGSVGFWVRGMDSAVLVGGAARRLRQPLVLEFAGELAPRGLLRAGYWQATRRADVVVLQDTRQPGFMPGALAARAFRRKVRLLPPGIEPERVQAALTLPRPDGTGPFTVLYAGTLHPRKNQMMLLRAAETLARRHPLLRVRLAGAVGDAAYAARLRDFARERLPAGMVEFLGWRDDVPALMRGSDVVVLCSRNEGIPQSLREAMHVEAPVIATDIGGVPDLVIDGDTGLLVPYDDADALARALERCIADPPMLRRVALRAREHVQSRFSFRAWADGYNRLLDEVFTA
jgi:glycosyltransferase involved in cell wall biosynthesis